MQFLLIFCLAGMFGACYLVYKHYFGKWTCKECRTEVVGYVGKSKKILLTDVCEECVLEPMSRAQVARRLASASTGRPNSLRNRKHGY